MAAHRWSFLCSRTTIDPVSNNLSVSDIIDEMQVGGVPPVVQGTMLALPINMQFVSLWRRTDLARSETAQMRLVFVDPRGEEIAHTPDQPLDLTQHKQVRSIADLSQWPFRGFGLYKIRVQQRPNSDAPWTTVDDVPVQIDETRGVPGATPVAPPAAE